MVTICRQIDIGLQQRFFRPKISHFRPNLATRLQQRFWILSKKDVAADGPDSPADRSAATLFGGCNPWPTLLIFGRTLKSFAKNSPVEAGLCVIVRATQTLQTPPHPREASFFAFLRLKKRCCRPYSLQQRLFFGRFPYGSSNAFWADFQKGTRRSSLWWRFYTRETNLNFRLFLAKKRCCRRPSQTPPQKLDASLGSIQTPPRLVKGRVFGAVGIWAKFRVYTTFGPFFQKALLQAGPKMAIFPKKRCCSGGGVFDGESPSFWRLFGPKFCRIWVKFGQIWVNFGAEIGQNLIP